MERNIGGRLALPRSLLPSRSFFSVFFIFNGMVCVFVVLGWSLDQTKRYSRSLMMVLEFRFFVVDKGKVQLMTKHV